ncbi:hypothetical protein IGI04_017105, partial [Brassica rapa subsp. trilocularis]
RDVSPFFDLPIFFPFDVPAFDDISFLRIGDGFEREVVRLGGTAATGPLDFSCLVFFPGGRPGLRLAADRLVLELEVRRAIRKAVSSSCPRSSACFALSILTSLSEGSVHLVYCRRACFASPLASSNIFSENFCSGEPEGASGGRFPGKTEEDVPDSFAIDRHFYRRKMSVPGIPSSTFRDSIRNYRESSRDQRERQGNSIKVSIVGGNEFSGGRRARRPESQAEPGESSPRAVFGLLDNSQKGNNLNWQRGEKKSAPIRDKGPRDNREEYPWDR